MVDSVALDVNHGFMFRLCKGNALTYMRGRGCGVLPYRLVGRSGLLEGFRGSRLVVPVACRWGCLRGFVTPAIG